MQTDAGQPITLRNTPTSLASSSSTPSSASTLLIFTTYHDIRIANLSRNHVTSITTITKDLVEGAGLDFYYDKQLMCWTDQGMEAIQCRRMNATFYVEKAPSGPVGIEELIENNDQISIITKRIEKPEGLAVDWYTDKIYWVEGELNNIEVTTLSGKYRKLLFWTDLDQPRAISLVPAQQLMIWCDWGEVPRIERASMDGDKYSRMILVSDRIYWPNGLTVRIIFLTVNLLYNCFNLVKKKLNTELKSFFYAFAIMHHIILENVLHKFF